MKQKFSSIRSLVLLQTVVMRNLQPLPANALISAIHLHYVPVQAEGFRVPDGNWFLWCIMGLGDLIFTGILPFVFLVVANKNKKVRINL